ncbi:MAG: glycosyltransferase family 2 protein [Bacteroidetes bacterium]|nr:glycosyltransferase family 2 protein [Bacteroidota bacterium]
MKTAAIVPAYNESQSIAAVVNELNEAAKQAGIALTVIVVNDCSKDDTGAQIDRLDCVALHLPVNLGIGGAVQTGFRYAFENGYDAAVQVDGDGQHPADAVPMLLMEMQRSKADVVIGSRFITGQGFQSSFLRRLGIKWFSLLNKMLTGLRVADTTSGLRLFSRRALQMVSHWYPDEYPEPEILVQFARAELHIREIPVQMRERQGGTSSIDSVRALYYMWKVTLAILFTRMRKIEVPEQ